jgi:hypothetical protein
MTEAKLGVFGKLRALFTEPDIEVEAERRSSKRVQLPIPVMIQVGEGEFESKSLQDLGLLGLSITKGGNFPVGSSVQIQFGAYEGISAAFMLQTEVVRSGGGDVVARDSTVDSKLLCVTVDREKTPAKGLDNYRRLVSHYVRHRPLLEDLRIGYFEGRCTKEGCNWLGRVGSGKPTCSLCGAPVTPLHKF